MKKLISKRRRKDRVRKALSPYVEASGLSLPQMLGVVLLSETVTLKFPKEAHVSFENYGERHSVNILEQKSPK